MMVMYDPEIVLIPTVLVNCLNRIHLVHFQLFAFYLLHRQFPEKNSEKKRKEKLNFVQMEEEIQWLLTSQ